MAHDVVAVSDLSLEIYPGECVGLIGESGSGKSTVGRCLVGLESPTAGSVRIGGRDAASYDRLSRADRDALRRTVQLVFQNPYSSLNPSLTIGATIRESLRLRRLDRHRADAEIKRLLTSVGIATTYADKKPHALSGGERQRVALARALAVQPELLICDECVSALDVAVRAKCSSSYARCSGRWA